MLNRRDDAESDNESFNLEDLLMFLNSVLEKAELICCEENVDSRAVETRQCKNIKRRLRTADFRLHARGTMQTRGKMPNEDWRPGGK